MVNDLQIGGLQRVVSVNANAFFNVKGIDATLYVCEKKDSYYDVHLPTVFFEKKLRIGFLSRRLIRKSLHLIGKKPHTFFMIKSQIRDIKKIIKRESVDTIILTAAQTLYASELKKTFPNLNVISWEHNNAETYLNKYYRDVYIEFIKALNNSDTVVSLTKQDAQKFGEFNKNSICIYNPLTIENSSKSDLKVQNISFVGRIDIEHKGLDFLVDVANKMDNDWTFSIAGSGTKKDEAIFKKLIKDRGVQDKIILRGALQGENLKEHFLNSSLYVMTSRWEGFGLVLAEAMSFGLPIIAFSQTGSQEVLDNGDYGILVENGNVDEMVRQIKHLISDIELRKEFQNKSLKRVESFSIDSIVQEWLDII